jgi:hypothetical protein
MSILNSVALRNQTTLIVSAIVMGLLAPGKAVLLAGKTRSAGDNLAKASCKMPPRCDSLPPLAEKRFLSRASAS